MRLLTTAILGILMTMGPIKSDDTTSPLKDKIIVIDPGHGGTAAIDSFRVGPSGEREEWVNLRVAVYLKEMLQECGAQVFMTRSSDENVSLYRRPEIAWEVKADVFVSIHHNATADSTVNFPIVYFHGNSSENIASVMLGRHVVSEFANILFKGNTPASLVSDHTIFPNSGAAVLRKSYGIPAIIGEASFFTNILEEKRLKMDEYNRIEAQAYKNALESYFRANETIIHPKYSISNLNPFQVLQEAERMGETAKNWQLNFNRGKTLAENGDSLEIALELLTLSAKGFPDSYLAGQAHLERSRLLRQLGQHGAAEIELQRVKEFYP